MFLKLPTLRPGLTTLFLGLILPSLETPGIHLSAQETDPRIQRVEEGISGSIQIRGRNPELFSITDRMKHYGVPGVSVAILEGGEIVWAQGYGVKDITTGEPVDPETLFQAASISKPVAAMAALKLVEQGVLDLDAPVNQYLKSWKLPENRFTTGMPVTLRHLLTHTGGLTVHGFPGYALDAPLATTVEVLDGSGAANTDPIRVDTVPGSLWRYSGGGYTIMQQLLVDVTGKPFPELMRELVLDPAEMALSSYAQPLPPEKEEYAASAHMSDGSTGDGKWHLYPEMAAAGLWTNPTELGRLALHVQAASRGEPGHLLSPKMTQAQLTPGLGGYGLGFAVRGEGSSARFTHGGSNYGFKALFLAFVEGGRGVFIMTNGERGSALAQEISLAVAREFEWPEPRYQEIALAEVSRDLLQEVSGDYRLEEEDLDIRVLLEEDHLRIEVPDPAGAESPQVILAYPTSEVFFIDLQDGRRFRVDRDVSGTVVALQVLGGPKLVRTRRGTPESGLEEDHVLHPGCPSQFGIQSG
jgi:CubicO group peptidase (beta-lactamase class C family)